MKRVSAELFETAWGWMALCWRGEAICRVFLPGRRRQVASELASLAIPVGEGVGSELAGRCRRYFEGERVDFSVPLEFPPVSGFRRRVWRAAVRVPYGEVVTYGELAVRAGSPGGARAAGQAMAHNPLPLIVPCHRVVAADGSLGGFSAEGGLALKRRLLALEGVFAVEGRRRRRGPREGQKRWR